MTKEQSWILTDLDAHTIDFENFKYDYTNFTMFRSVDYSRPFVKHSLHKYEKIIIDAMNIIVSYMNKLHINLRYCGIWDCPKTEDFPHQNTKRPNITFIGHLTGF